MSYSVNDCKRTSAEVLLLIKQVFVSIANEAKMIDKNSKQRYTLSTKLIEFVDDSDFIKSLADSANQSNK